MADHTPAGPLEMGAKMDYAEHTSTYARFLMLAKFGSLFCVALLISMAFAFFGGGGLISGFILLVLIFALGSYFLR